MPRRERPPEARRSEGLIRKAVNENTAAFEVLVRGAFNWPESDKIDWRSSIASDGYSEYYDQEFLDRLDVVDLKVPLREFWPDGGPRWDALAKTSSGKLLLVEAKAYIEEAVDFASRAGPRSLEKINAALASAKQAFGAAPDASWSTPFYQYANRLAHLYFLRGVNGRDAYLLFVNFADAEDVPRPCTTHQWEGASRLMEKALGLGAHPFREHVRTLNWSVSDMGRKNE